MGYIILNINKGKITNAPTKSRISLVSTPDRHLLFMGTQPTIGTNPQDDLLIRFSSQEDINTYQPTAGKHRRFFYC